MRFVIPQRLVLSCQQTPAGAGWLERLPEQLRELVARWSLTLEPPFAGEGSCAWVAAGVRVDGSLAVLKIGMPHMEAEGEIHGLRVWDGNPTVQLLEADDAAGAMLLERCRPGTSLRAEPEEKQDEIVAGLLRRLWRVTFPPHTFRPLSAMVAYWAEETLADFQRWTDPGLIQEGLSAFAELTRPGSADVLLATDLHAGNVLRAEREPWLVIDPKPFVGDPAYDATQHLFNCEGRMRSNPSETIQRFADLLEVNPERVRRWMFARAAAEPREEWAGAGRLALARALAS